MQKFGETKFRNNLKKVSETVVTIKKSSPIPIGIFNATIAHVAIFEKAETNENARFLKVTFAFEHDGEQRKTNNTYPIKWFDGSYLLQFLQSLEVDVEDGQNFDFAELIGLNVEILIEEIQNKEGQKINCVTTVEIA